MWVVKIGGSLINRTEDLSSLVRAIVRISSITPIAIVAGGGRYADIIRVLDEHSEIGPSGAHWLAVLTMHFNAYRLKTTWPQTFSVSYNPRPQGRGRVPILLPYTLVKDSSLPQSWEVTSDTISALLAHRLGCGLALLKSVEGVYDRHPGGTLLKTIHTEELAQLRHSPVDPFLPIYLSSHGMDAWVLTGRDPARLERLMNNGRTHGTHIYSDLRTISP
jgi:hypothetical protein